MHGLIQGLVIGLTLELGYSQSRPNHVAENESRVLSEGIQGHFKWEKGGVDAGRPPTNVDSN